MSYRWKEKHGRKLRRSFEKIEADREVSTANINI
jgi:hypothetical protein